MCLAYQSGSKTPSEIARSWQGTGKYPGIDDYVDITVEKGTVLYRGEPNGTEYFTTLDEQQIIDNRKYIVSLFFRNGKIYMMSLICCDKEFSEKDEDKRKILHDDILNELGINQQMEYSWGKISSDYDARSNVSSIDIMYF